MIVGSPAHCKVITNLRPAALPASVTFETAHLPLTFLQCRRRTLELPLIDIHSMSPESGVSHLSSNAALSFAPVGFALSAQ